METPMYTVKETRFIVSHTLFLTAFAYQRVVLPIYWEGYRLDPQNQVSGDSLHTRMGLPKATAGQNFERDINAVVSQLEMTAGTISQAAKYQSFDSTAKADVNIIPQNIYQALMDDEYIKCPAGQLHEDEEFRHVLVHVLFTVIWVVSNLKQFVRAGTFSPAIALKAKGKKSMYKAEAIADHGLNFTVDTLDRLGVTLNHLIKKRDMIYRHIND